MGVMLRWIPMSLALLLVAGCKPKTLEIGYEVVAEHPHDTGCYTQGLEFLGGMLLESGGQYGESNVRRVEPETGKVFKQRDFPASIFAEGLTVFDDKLWLLTWEQETCYVLKLDTFELIHRFNYKGEGWGICTNGSELIMSDGSSTLFVRNPKDFSLVRKIEVTLEGRPRDQLNELEWVDGVIYANIYQQDEIVRIDPDSGQITGVMDLSALREKFDFEDAEELNGIAHDPKTGHLWVTGKYWPKMFEIELK